MTDNPQVEVEARRLEDLRERLERMLAEPAWRTFYAQEDEVRLFLSLIQSALSPQPASEPSCLGEALDRELYEGELQSASENAPTEAMIEAGEAVLTSLEKLANTPGLGLSLLEWSDHVGKVREAAARIATLGAENARLMETLERYGGHVAGCCMGGLCTCGWQTARAASGAGDDTYVRAGEELSS